jgi:hypothetical protein
MISRFCYREHDLALAFRIPSKMVFVASPSLQRAAVGSLKQSSKACLFGKSRLSKRFRHGEEGSQKWH